MNPYLGPAPSTIPQELHPLEIEFLKLHTGDDSLSKKQEVAECLRHMSSLIGDGAINLFRQTLDPGFEPSFTDFHRMLGALLAMVEILCADSNKSIPRILEQLTTLRENPVFRKNPGPGVDFEASCCVISLFGWYSLLFIPPPTITKYTFKSDIKDYTFDIEPQGAKCFIQRSVQLASVQRPFDELLLSFGELLPRGRTTKADVNKKFHVSNLNVATLKRLADIEIVWVDTVSAHLDFDPTIPALYIFKAPSYCKLNAYNAAVLPSSVFPPEYSTYSNVADRIIGKFYIEGEHPLSYQDLMEEVILSYGLLFRDWSSSRKVYRQEERERATIKGMRGNRAVDPWLDILCGMDYHPTSWLSKQDGRETYDAKTNFPILSKRLEAIQDYVEGIRPGRIYSLWHDNRDLRSWYTLWIVVVLGVISIIQALILIVLTAWLVDIERSEAVRKSS